MRGYVEAAVARGERPAAVVLREVVPNILAPVLVDAGLRFTFSLATPLNAALSINADGSGNLGASTVAVTNGTVLYFIDETGHLPPVVQVFEQ